MRVAIGLLLIFAAVAFLLFSIIPAITDENQFVLDIFEPIYCGAGEQLSAEREVGPTTDADGSEAMGYTAYYTCTRADETTYDATGKAWLVSGGVFTLALLLGIGFIISGSRARATAYAQSLPTGYSAQVRPTTRRNASNDLPSSGYKFDTTTAAPVSAPEDLFNLPLEKPVEAPMTVAATGLTASTMFDLQEKLRQLEEAYDHHLINREEYERKRDEILREFK
jgi:hypothetical protein